MVKYTVREENYKKILNGKWVETKDVFIMRCDDINNPIWLPSKFTEYIDTELEGLEINSQIRYARTITSFLNYVLEQTEKGEDELFTVIKEKGLYGLDLYHVASFITNMTETTGNLRKTVKDKEAELISFMLFLYRRGITGERGRIETKIVPKRRIKEEYRQKRNGYTKGERVWINPFEADKDKYRVKYPKKGNKNRVLEDMNQDVWEQLIEYAEKYYPQIAFGFALQCMAGLRQGEVVNLTIDNFDIEREKNRITLTIEDNPQLFDRGIKTRSSQIKPENTTTAVVYNFNGRIFEMYDAHMKLINKTANKESKGLGAMFINADGFPMSGDSYGIYFGELKADFIELVYKYNATLAEKLKTETWGSHIGRHIFTNHLIKNNLVDDASGSPSPTLLQCARRDRSPKTAIKYISAKAVQEGAENTILK